MKKRLLATLLASTILLASCISAAPDMPTVPTRGHWEGNTFISAYFGLRFDMPEGWFAMTPENIIGLVESGAIASAFIPPEIILPGEVIPYEVFEEYGVISDVMAFYERDVRLHIDIWSLIHYDEIPFTTAAEYLAWMAEAEPFWGISFFTVIHDGTIRIGHLDWHVADSWIEGSEAITRYLVNDDGRFVRQIIISVSSSDKLDDILAMFRPY